MFLKDLWPTADEVQSVLADAITPEQFEDEYGRIWAGDEHWASLEAPTGTVYEWDPASTYVQEPPFFQDLAADLRGRRRRRGRPRARARSATRSRPTTSPRPVRSRRTRRRGST